MYYDIAKISRFIGMLQVLSTSHVYMFSDVVELLLYSPDRPILDYSVILLWLMAVGTIVFASLWSEITGSKQSDERYNQLSPDSPQVPLITHYVLCSYSLPFLV